MLKEFVLKTIKGMIGHELDYRVREYTLGWVSKGVLNEEDMLEIDALIEAKNNPVVEETTESEEVTEETTEQTETVE